jgi:hypothetical protein
VDCIIRRGFGTWRLLDLRCLRWRGSGAMVDRVGGVPQHLTNSQPLVMTERKTKRTKAADRALSKQQFNYSVVNA